jgi:hypothetical protein
VESNVYRSLVRNDPFLDVIPIHEGDKMLRTRETAGGLRFRRQGEIMRTVYYERKGAARDVSARVAKKEG